ncbi:MAG: CBS domain-containing protein [Planctomycetota bacterium]|nr:CBS domain-containing protein [Planctomycetota bacterium]MDA1161778.1 CBS domain-containing protein [Planctomycetota bacterium]
MQVTVRDVMTTQPPIISADTSLHEATRMILDRALSELYVVDETGRLLGTVSDYSLLKARMIKCECNECVSRFISRDMVLLSPDMRLDEVSGFFRESCHSRLAVVEDGRVIGQLSRRNVLRAMVVIDELTHKPCSESFENTDSSFESSDAVSGSLLTRRIESPAATMPPQPAGLRPVGEVACRTVSQSLGATTDR